MAAIAIQTVGAGGASSVTFAACNGGGDTVATGSKRMAGYSDYEVLLIVRNTNAATRTVTVGSLSGVVVPATTGVAVIPVPNEGINDPSVAVTYDAVTNLDIAAVRVGGSY